jgi:putative ABC transport system substrate-binding protein
MPKLSRVAVLVNPNHPEHPDRLKKLQAAAPAFGVKISAFEASNVAQIEAAFATLRREKLDALVVLVDGIFVQQRVQIAELAIKGRVATIFSSRESVAAGGFMSYGQNSADNYRRAAAYVDKILKGARPGDLPVERPTKLDLVINRKTARAFGIALPPELLLRADEVIE